MQTYKRVTLHQARSLKTFENSVIMVERLERFAIYLDFPAF